MGSFITYNRVVAFMVAIVGVFFLLPILVACVYEEYAVIPAFLYPMIGAWLWALLTWYFGRNKPIDLFVRGSYAVVAVAWLSAGFMGSIPLYFSGSVESFTDAFFEASSGITTTGATVLDDLESLPVSINFWRCTMHWIGGLGIIALTVALLPVLGVGGFQLIKAETTGPEKAKITPRITSTAKILCLIYLIFTITEASLLMLCGMPFIDACAHAMSNIATGGFSTRTESIGAYDSAAIDWICTIFMILASINFSLYYYAYRRKFFDILRNSELKAFLLIVFIVGLLVSIILIPDYDSFWDALRYGYFQVASVISTTGFATDDYEMWLPSAQALLLMLFFIGGCSGSTAGGVKVIRWVVLGKQLINELKRLLHPRALFSIRLNQNAARKELVFSVASFIAVYAVLVMLTTFIGALGGLDLFSALSAGLAMIGNVGPAFGSIGPVDNFGQVPTFVKWVYSFAMYAGRLELYTMLMFFLPAFWKK